LVRLDFFYTSRGRGNAKSDQRPRLGRRILGFRRPHVGYVHCKFGSVSDGGKNASELYNNNKFLSFIPNRVQFTHCNTVTELTIYNINYILLTIRPYFIAIYMYIMYIIYIDTSAVLTTISSTVQDQLFGD